MSDRRAPALLHGAQGFLFERRDAARDIAGRRVLVDRLAVVEEVAFEVIHYGDDAAKHVFTHGALHEQLFSAEDFGDLGEDRRAARGGHSIGHVTHERIRGDARESVGSAALQPDRERREWTGLALIAARDGDELFERCEALLGFVASALRGESTQARLVDAGHRGEQPVELVRFAAEPHDENAACIRVQGE